MSRRALHLAPSLLLSLGLLLPGAALAASGGPDSFGYYYADSNATGGIPYSSTIFDTAAASGIALTTAGGSNNSSESITLPFNFSFYGTTYSSLYVCANGYVSPTSTCTSSNTTFSSSTQGMMGPFWDDLDMSGSSSFVYEYTSGSSPNRILTIAFVAADRHDRLGEGNVTFAVQLYETSNLIVYQYKDVVFGGDNASDYDYGRSATVGIDEGATSGYYTQLSYNSNSYLTNSLAVAFSTTRAPIAEANGPYTANEGVATTISASGSVGLFGSITDYAFDCTSDGTYDSSGTSASASCTYPDNGTYTATVRVTNSTGVTSTDTATVTVANVAPVPTAANVLSGYYSSGTSTVGSLTYYTVYVYEGTSVSQTASASDVAADTVTIHYDWGDGTLSTGASGASVSHSFADDGTYDPTSYATDEDGGVSADIWNYLGYGLVFVVTNVAPTITSSSGTNSTEATASTFTATATDPGTADVLTYTWSYGDGSTGTGASSSHTYADDGTYTWTLTVTDGDGGSTTSSGTVTVTNVLPTIWSASFGTGGEGSPIAFSVNVTDPGTADVLSYSWNWGDGSSNTTSGSSTTHTYADNGSYTVTVTVSDDTGSVSSSGVSVISNVNPTIGATTWPTTGAEGVSASFAATATDPGILDTLTYLWTWGDGTSSSGDTATHTWADNGSYAVTLTVTDKDGGSTSETRTIVVSDVAPVITSLSGTTPLVEGDVGTFSGAATDVPADTITYTWDYGDGTKGTGATSTHVYADNGTYTVTLTATDNGGAFSTATTTITVTNANPMISSVTATDGDEGASLAVSAVATDPGTADVLSYSWDFGDGTTGTGNPTTHAWPDEGDYLVTLTVTDGDGGLDTETGSVTITNVAPTITSAPVLTATEGTLYDYQATASDPGSADVMSWSVVGPDGMAIGSGTGDLTWTPAYSDSFAPVSVSVTVDDGDGGTNTQDYTIEVTALDTDGDGMADGYELLNGLDPYNAADALTDADADGVSNLDESLAGTDPNVFDGPDAPVLYSPISNAVVAILTPDLVLDDAYSPRGLDLTYDYEVYADPDGTTLLAAAADVVETPDQTTWTVNVNLPDGSLIYWRARADDGLVDGPWSDYATFFTNAAGDAPSTPVPFSPVDDVVVTTLSPDYTWTIATDPAGGAVTYDVRVMDESLTTVLDEATGVTDDATDSYASWLTTAVMADATHYAWEVRAVTESGVQGLWSEPGYFTIDTLNLAPSDVSWVDPLEGAVLESVRPQLSWSVSVDPEGTAVTYEIEADVDSAFPDPAAWVSDVNQLDLSAIGGTLAENQDNWLRVRGVDADGLDSAWATIEVFVRGPDDAPTVPELLSPADASVASSGTPSLSCSESTDPEGDAITYEIEVSASADLSAPVATGTALVATDGVVTWDVTSALPEGTWYWSARALDDQGLASDWATPWSFDVSAADSGDTGDSGGTDSTDAIDTSSVDYKGGGCGCASTTGNVATLPAALGVVGLILVRRRRLTVS